LLTEIYLEAGLPPGVFNMLVGSGSVVGEAIVNSPVLRAISFTGSNEVGGALYAKAAQRGAKVTCEMGGKNAVIVMADADLDKAAIAIHGGAFGSTGQRCTATSRVIANPSIKGALIERLVDAAKKIKVGSGLDDTVDMGPAVDEKQWKSRKLGGGPIRRGPVCPAPRTAEHPAHDTVRDRRLSGRDHDLPKSTLN